MLSIFSKNGRKGSVKRHKRSSGSDSESDERLPSGVIPGHGLSPVSSLWIKGINDDFINPAKRHFQNTFEVVENHEKLPNGGGARFNIETVPQAEDTSLNKPRLSRDEFLRRVQQAASNVYDSDRSFGRRRRGDDFGAEDIRLEAVSKTPNDLVFAGSQGFFAACLSAFAEHLPIAISPEHIWALISYAFAKHVDKHAEELRANFVEHEGKKRLEVVADHLVMSGGSNPDSGSAAEVWEQTVFSSFSKQIKSHIGETIHSAIAGDFSTTTATTRAVHEITLMSAMKHYFSYGVSTCCGIPRVTLLGTEEDWVSVRTRAEALGKLMAPKFSSMWLPVLLPVLDEFVASYRGQVNYGFWQSMVKLRQRGGSGARSVVSGWIQILYPYLKADHLNSDLRPWQEMYFRGPDPKNIPPIASAAPVDWNYHGSTHDLHFNAGFIGCSQDPDGTLTPQLGWYVAHDPPQEPEARLKQVKKEIEDLIKGHNEGAKATAFVGPWFERVSVLHLEHKSIHGMLIKRIQQEQAEVSRNWRYEESEKQEKIGVLDKKIAAQEQEAPYPGSVEDMIKSFFLKDTHLKG